MEVSLPWFMLLVILPVILIIWVDLGDLQGKESTKGKKADPRMFERCPFASY